MYNTIDTGLKNTYVRLAPFVPMKIVCSFREYTSFSTSSFRGVFSGLLWKSTLLFIFTAKVDLHYEEYLCYCNARTTIIIQSNPLIKEQALKQQSKNSLCRIAWLQLMNLTMTQAFSNIMNKSVVWQNVILTVCTIMEYRNVPRFFY